MAWRRDALSPRGPICEQPTYFLARKTSLDRSISFNMCSLSPIYQLLGVYAVDFSSLSRPNKSLREWTLSCSLIRRLHVGLDSIIVLFWLSCNVFL